MGVWVLRLDVFGAVAKPQLCSEHVGTCTCGGYINTKSTSDCVQSIMYTHIIVESIYARGGNLFQSAYKCGSHALK